MDDDALERAISLVERYDAYKALNKIESAHPDASEEELAELLWDVFRSGEVELDEEQYLHRLAESPNAYDADDVVEVVDQLADLYGSDGKMPTEYGSTWLWNDDEDLPGCFNGLYQLLTAKGDDEAYLETLDLRRDLLPDPYDGALGYMLAQLGHLDVEALDDDFDDLLGTVARLHLGTDNMHHKKWNDPIVWDDETWGEALVEAARDSDLVIRKMERFAELATYCETEELVDVAHRIGYTSGIWDAIDIVTDRGHDVVVPVEEALAALEGTIERPESRQPWPVFTLSMAYLELCDQFGCVPSPELDDVFEAFVTHYEPAWYGSGEDEHHRRLREALSTIPADRLESILLAPDTLNFWLIGALSSSDDVLNRVVENLASAHNLNWQQQKAIEPGLVSLGTDGLPAFRELIAGDDFDQEQTVVEALAALEADEAAPVLALVLEDRRKTMREPARKGLAELSDDVVLEAIEAPLNASRKHTRLAAAKVLANLPKSDRRYELAQGRLEEERTQDVQDVLEKIEPPGDEEVSDIDREAVFERLEEEDLSGWREIADEIGVEIVRLASEYMARQTLGWSYHDQLNAFYEMIERFADEPETVEHAVGALSHSGRHSEDLLEGICERLDGVLDELHRQLIDTDRLDDSYYLDEQDVVTWIAEEAPDEGRSVLLDILEDRRKTMRRPAIEGLASLGESVVEDVTSLLRDDDTKADGRDAAARTLGEIGSPDALDDLEAALDEEGSSRVAEAIEEAIVSCRGAAVDVTEYDEASELDEALASLEMERPDVMPEEVPTVHWASGEALSEGALDWMLAKLMRENQETHDEQLLAVRARLDDTDCHELCDALLDEAHQTDRGWGLYIQGVIGSDSHIDDLGGTLEDLASSASTNWGTDGVEVLVRHGSDTAAQWLDHWVRKSSRDALLDRARDGLERIAEQRGMSVDDLVLKATPDFGFGASGEQRVDFGSRDIVVRLNADSGLEFEDDEGEVRDWFPSARKADDDEKVQAAKDRFRGMRRRIEQITQGVAERFEDAMITGRTWPLEEWRELFVEQALAFQLTRALLFEYHVGDAETPVRFAVSEEATCLDADGSELDVPEESEIGLAHPLNLDDEALDAWRTHFDERDVEPPFPQLDRETHPPESIPDDEDDLLLELPKIHPRPFMNRLGDLGYQRGSRRDAGLIHDAHTSIGDYWVELDHEGYSPEAVDAIGDVSIEGVVVWERDDESAPTTLSFEREPLDLDELPPRIASEIVRDLERLTEEA